MSSTVQPWQVDMLKKMEGIRKGEMFVISSGRQSGKSMLNTVYQQWVDTGRANFETHGGSTLVDGHPWYQISCSAEVARWIRTQEKTQWYEEPTVRYRSLFDVSEQLYLMLGMKWQ
jgi:hypothetical protein